MNSLNKRKAQVAIEFLMIVGAVVFFVSLFLLAMQKTQEDKIYQHQDIRLKEIALTVQNEINMASDSTSGYSRNFKIPEKSGSQEYEITIDMGIIYIKTLDDSHALTLPIPQVIGNISKGENKIEKINEQIYLNQ